MNNRFYELVQDFLTKYLIDECNYSDNTRKSYATVFRIFIKFIKEEKINGINEIEIELITKEVIIQFLDWLERNRKNSISTRNHRLMVLKSFFRYVLLNEPDLSNNCFKILNINFKKVPKKIISYFTEDEIKMIINYLNDIKDLKHLTMICVLYETAARVSEFINIKISDLDLRDNANIVLYGKGSKARKIPISQELVKLINLYINEVYIDYGENYLFYSTHKNKFHRDSINKYIDKLVKILKEKHPGYFLKKYHPHSLRHSKGTNLYNNNTPLLYIKEFLGHKSITSTQIYATPDTAKQRKEILKNAQSIKTKTRYTKTNQDDFEEWLKMNMK